MFNLLIRFRLYVDVFIIINVTTIVHANMDEHKRNQSSSTIIQENIAIVTEDPLKKIYTAPEYTENNDSDENYDIFGTNKPTDMKKEHSTKILPNITAILHKKVMEKTWTDNHIETYKSELDILRETQRKLSKMIPLILFPYLILNHVFNNNKKSIISIEKYLTQEFPKFEPPMIDKALADLDFKKDLEEMMKNRREFNKLTKMGEKMQEYDGQVFDGSRYVSGFANNNTQNNATDKISSMLQQAVNINIENNNLNINKTQEKSMEHNTITQSSTQVFKSTLQTISIPKESVIPTTEKSIDTETVLETPPNNNILKYNTNEEYNATTAKITFILTTEIITVESKQNHIAQTESLINKLENNKIYIDSNLGLINENFSSTENITIANKLVKEISQPLVFPEYDDMKEILSNLEEMSRKNSEEEINVAPDKAEATIKAPQINESFQNNYSTERLKEHEEFPLHKVEYFNVTLNDVLSNLSNKKSLNNDLYGVKANQFSIKVMKELQSKNRFSDSNEIRNDSEYIKRKGFLMPDTNNKNLKEVQNKHKDFAESLDPKIWGKTSEKYFNKMHVNKYIQQNNKSIKFPLGNENIVQMKYNDEERPDYHLRFNPTFENKTLEELSKKMNNFGKEIDTDKPIKKKDSELENAKKYTSIFFENKSLKETQKNWNSFGNKKNNDHIKMKPKKKGEVKNEYNFPPIFFENKTIKETSKKWPNFGNKIHASTKMKLKDGENESDFKPIIFDNKTLKETNRTFKESVKNLQFSKSGIKIQNELTIRKPEHEFKAQYENKKLKEIANKQSFPERINEDDNGLRSEEDKYVDNTTFLKPAFENKILKESQIKMQFPVFQKDKELFKNSDLQKFMDKNYPLTKYFDGSLLLPFAKPSNVKVLKEIDNTSIFPSNGMWPKEPVIEEEKYKLAKPNIGKSIHEKHQNLSFPNKQTFFNHEHPSNEFNMDGNKSKEFFPTENTTKIMQETHKYVTKSKMVKLITKSTQKTKNEKQTYKKNPKVENFKFVGENTQDASNEELSSTTDDFLHVTNNTSKYKQFLRNDKDEYTEYSTTPDSNNFLDKAYPIIQNHDKHLNIYQKEKEEKYLNEAHKAKNYPIDNKARKFWEKILKKHQIIFNNNTRPRFSEINNKSDTVNKSLGKTIENSDIFIPEQSYLDNSFPVFDGGNGKNFKWPKKLKPNRNLQEIHVIRKYNPIKLIERVYDEPEIRLPGVDFKDFPTFRKTYNQQFPAFDAEELLPWTSNVTNESQNSSKVFKNIHIDQALPIQTPNNFNVVPLFKTKIEKHLKESLRYFPNAFPTVEVASGATRKGQIMHSLNEKFPEFDENEIWPYMSLPDSTSSINNITDETTESDIQRKDVTGLTPDSTVSAEIENKMEDPRKVLSSAHEYLDKSYPVTNGTGDISFPAIRKHDLHKTLKENNKTRKYPFANTTIKTQTVSIRTTTPFRMYQNDDDNEQPWIQLSTAPAPEPSWLYKYKRSTSKDNDIKPEIYEKPYPKPKEAIPEVKHIYRKAMVIDILPKIEIVNESLPVHDTNGHDNEKLPELRYQIPLYQQIYEEVIPNYRKMLPISDEKPKLTLEEVMHIEQMVALSRLEEEQAKNTTKNKIITNLPNFERHFDEDYQNLEENALQLKNPEITDETKIMQSLRKTIALNEKFPELSMRINDLKIRPTKITPVEKLDRSMPIINDPHLNHTKNVFQSSNYDKKLKEIIATRTFPLSKDQQKNLTKDLILQNIPFLRQITLLNGTTYPKVTDNELIPRLMVPMKQIQKLEQSMPIINGAHLNNTIPIFRRPSHIKNLKEINSSRHYPYHYQNTDDNLYLDKKSQAEKKQNRLNYHNKEKTNTVALESQYPKQSNKIQKLDKSMHVMNDPYLNNTLSLFQMPKADKYLLENNASRKYPYYEDDLNYLYSQEDMADMSNYIDEFDKLNLENGSSSLETTGKLQFELDNMLSQSGIQILNKLMPIVNDTNVDENTFIFDNYNKYLKEINSTKHYEYDKSATNEQVLDKSLPIFQDPFLNNTRVIVQLQLKKKKLHEIENYRVYSTNKTQQPETVFDTEQNIDKTVMGSMTKHKNLIKTNETSPIDMFLIPEPELDLSVKGKDLQTLIDKSVIPIKHYNNNKSFPYEYNSNFQEIRSRKFFPPWMIYNKTMSELNTSCGIENSNNALHNTNKMIKEGIAVAEIETYPWLGVLVYIKGRKRLLSSVVMVSKQMVIGSAVDIFKLPKTDFRKRAKVILGHNCSGPKINVMEYNYHPEYELNTFSALVMIQLDLTTYHGDVSRLRAICAPPIHLADTKFHAFVLNDDCRNSSISVYEMTLVDQGQCKIYYNNNGLNVESIWPTHTVCAAATSGGRCVWRHGAVLATKLMGRWHLMGFGVNGPGCEAPARFIDYSLYDKWVSNAILRVGLPSVTRVAVNHVILRRKPSHMQRYGPCDGEETNYKLYEDSTHLLPRLAGGTVVYNLTLHDRYEYSCIVIKAYSEDKLFSQLNKPKIEINRYCTTDIPICYTSGMTSIDFYVKVLYFYTIKLVVTIYGIEFKTVDVKAWTRMANDKRNRPGMPYTWKKRKYLWKKTDGSNWNYMPYDWLPW